MDDTELARELDTHLGDHQERVRDCVVCIVIMAHLLEWRHHGDPVAWGLP